MSDGPSRNRAEGEPSCHTGQLDQGHPLQRERVEHGDDQIGGDDPGKGGARHQGCCNERNRGQSNRGRQRQVY